MQWAKLGGKGTEIMTITAGNCVPLAVTIDSASPHKSKLGDETFAGSFLDSDPLDEKYRIENDRAKP